MLLGSGVGIEIVQVTVDLSIFRALCIFDDGKPLVVVKISHFSLFPSINLLPSHHLRLHASAPRIGLSQTSGILRVPQTLFELVAG